MDAVNADMDKLADPEEHSPEQLLFLLHSLLNEAVVGAAADLTYLMGPMMLLDNVIVSGPPGAVFNSTCWGKCKGGAHSEQVGKLCTSIELSKAAYPTPLETQKRALVRKVSSVWGEAEGGRISVDVMKYAPGAQATARHRDHSQSGAVASASLAVYLTGAETNPARVVFPVANVSVSPKVGRAAAWLNVLPDGSSTEHATHGVEASPAAAKGDRLVLFLSTVFAPSRFEAAARRLGEEGYEGKRGDSSVRALMGDGVVGRALFEIFDDETAEGVVGSACRGVGAVLPSSAVGFLGRHLSPSTFPCAAILQPATFGAKLAIEVVEKQKRK